MCRISYFPRGMTDEYSRPQIVQILKDLEKSRGGHGNGFYYFGGNHIYKSVKMSINKMIKKGAWKQGFLFHTRLATHGDKTRKNTHPFRLDGGEVFIHNGVWSDYKIALPFCNPKSNTDSEVLGYWIRNTGYTEFPSTYGTNAVLMRIVRDGETKIVVGRQASGSLKVVKKGNYAWIQSESPAINTYDESYEIQSGIYVIDNSIEGVLSLPESVYVGYGYPNYNGRWQGYGSRNRTGSVQTAITNVSRTKQTTLDKAIVEVEDNYWWAWGE